MKLLVTIVTLSLLCPAPLVAREEEGTPIGRPIALAAAREAARLAQSGANGDEGNPFLRPSLVMIGVGLAVAIAGSTMPQLRTQTDEYDLCAAEHGGPTGPSTRVPACDEYRTVNKGILAAGLASAIGGAALLTVGAFKSVTVQVTPGRIYFGKTARF